MPSQTGSIDLTAQVNANNNAKSYTNDARTWYATCDTAAATVAKVATTTDSGFTLHDGVVVDVKFTNTNSGAVASLTLNVNDTGAKSIKTMYNNSLANLAHAGQLYAGLVVRFVYSGTYWIAATNYNSDTYGRTRWQNVIKAIATANSVTSGHIICGTESGYRDIAASVSFDLSYPLLYSGTTISAASGTTDNAYLSINSINITSNGTVQSAAQYKTVYLKGTLSGNMFTIAASNFLTCVVPTTSDGCVYIPLGMFYNSTTNIYFNSSKELWAYVDGAFGPVSVREASAAAKTATNYITHVDSNGITIHPSSNTNNRVGINANGMTVYKGGYLKANFADTITLYGGSNASGANPKMEVTSTQIKMTSSDGTQRLSADSSTGVVVGNPSKGRVVVNDNGLTIYDVNNRKRSAINSDGLEVFAGTDSASVAKFGSTTRIGKTGESHILQDYHSLQMVDSNGVTYFHVSDLRGTGGLAEIVDTFRGDGSTVTFNLSFVATDTNYTVTVSDSSGGTITKKTTSITFSTAPTGLITVTYATASSSAKAYTIGTRYDGNVGGLSVAEGSLVIASGVFSHAEGHLTKASGYASHAEGYRSIASGYCSHAEGWSSAENTYSHAEGHGTVASGGCSHAEGHNTVASASWSHAEGDESVASSTFSHAEGRVCTASGRASHAEGEGCVASGMYSHAQNFHTTAAVGYQTVIGAFNDNQQNTVFEIGNGEFGSNSNALVVDWDGNLIAQGMAGMVQMFAGSTAPTGWLMCDGSAVSRTTYAILFAVIGTTWGSGDGSTTFNLPDLRGRAPIGAGTGSGLTARTLAAKTGAETHTLTAAQSGLPAHTHAFTQPTVKTELKFQKNAASGSALNRVAGSNLSNPADTSTYTATVTGGAVGAVTGGAQSASSAHNIMQPSVAINFIICTGKTS